MQRAGDSVIIGSKKVLSHPLTRVRTLAVLLLLALAGLRLAAAAPAPAPSGAAASSPAPVVEASAAPAGPASSAPAAPASAAPVARSSGAPVRPYSDAADEGPRQWLHGEEINWTKQISTTIVWLVLMCGGIWAILRFMYGRMGMAGLGGATRRNIQVLDRHMLGPQKALLMVSVPGKILLLGMTEHNITTLTELAPEDVEMVNLGAVPIQTPFGVRSPAEKASGFEAPPPPDNLVDLAGLFGRRGAQNNKGEEQE